jgi:hypothetical protein
MNPTRLILEVIAWLAISGVIAVLAAGALAIRAIVALDSLVRRIIR